MRRHERDLRRLLALIAEQKDAELLRLETTSGGHLRTVFRKGSALVSLFTGSTPSDRRATYNLAATARRLLQTRELH